MKLIAIHEHKNTKQTKKQKCVVGKVFFSILLKTDKTYLLKDKSQSKKKHLSFCKLYIMYYLDSSLRSYRNLFEKKILYEKFF